MPRFKYAIVHADSNDFAQYDRLARLVKSKGFEYMACGTLAELTQEQIYDEKDFWLRWAIQSPGLMKIVETPLINGIFSKAHIEKNAALLREKSKILARHGLRGVVDLLEPQILPESFYEKHPNLRGARCDNPCYARNPYYSPCVDQQEVLDHYREAVRGLLDLGPEVAVLSFCTNDSGAGVCWCSGLYPGRNGPDECKDVAMGARMRKWILAMQAGAADAGRNVEIFFRPLHFGKYEIHDVIDKLPRRTHVVFKMSLSPNRCFILPENQEHINRCREKKRGAALIADPTMGYQLWPLCEKPLPYFILDMYREAAASGVTGVTGPTLSEGVEGVESPTTMATVMGLKQPPMDNVAIERAVMKIAAAQVGKRLAGVLADAWRDVDHALRLWPTWGDTNNFLFLPNSVMGDRWILRPIVPAPERLSEEDKAYFSKHRHMSRDRRDSDSFFVWHNTKNYKTDEMKWLVVIYDEMMRFMDRAMKTLDAARGKMEGEEDGARKRFERECGRVAALRALWRTQRNVLRAGSIIEFFTGEKKDEYWHVLRKDEYCYEPATYRRFFLEAVDDEIANSREMIALMKESDEPLIGTGEPEASFVLPTNLTELLEKKIALMEAHRDDIDALFPNCPEETFADPSYDWADVNQEKDRALRQKDRDRAKEGVRGV
jgi:hypothetical protein